MNTALLVFVMFIFGLLLAVLAIVLVTMVIFLGDNQPSSDGYEKPDERHRGILFSLERYTKAWSAHLWGGWQLAR